MKRIGFITAIVAGLLVAVPAAGASEPDDGLIAVEWFDSIAPEVRIIDQSGTTVEVVDFGTGPQWSHDGRYLSYVDHYGRLVAVEPTSGTSWEVFPETIGSEPTYRWAIDSHTLLLTSADETTFWAVAVDGTVEHKISRLGGGAWSPTGEYIIYADVPTESGCAGCYETLLDPDGGELPLEAWKAVWSPAGTIITTLSFENPDGSGDLIVANLDVGTLQSTELFRLPGSAPWTFTPFLSPDGRWLASFDVEGNLELRDLTSDTVLSTVVTDLVSTSDIEWAPDSTAFIVHREDEGSRATTVFDLSLDVDADLDGGKATWSPTGTFLLFDGPNGMTLVSKEDAGTPLTEVEPAIAWDWQPFVITDISDSMFRADIIAAWEAGVTKGCNPPLNNAFCPNRPVTRGQMAAFLNRALDLPGPPDSSSFADTDGHVFEGDIIRIAYAGITKGCNQAGDDTKFCPDAYVTRGQMAAFLVRALDLPPTEEARFTDTADSIFRDDISRLAAAGITKGCNPPDNDLFCPDSHVTRAQMTAFLNRAGLLD